MCGTRSTLSFQTNPNLIANQGRCPDISQKTAKCRSSFIGSHPQSHARKDITGPTNMFGISTPFCQPLVVLRLLTHLLTRIGLRSSKHLRHSSHYPRTVDIRHRDFDSDIEVPLLVHHLWPMMAKR